MPASHNPDPGEDSVDIELSARDLLELSAPAIAQQPSIPSGQDSGKTFATKIQPPETTPPNRKAISTRAWNAPRLAMIAGGAFAAIAVGSVVRYESAASVEMSQPSSIPPAGIAQADAFGSEDQAATATQAAPVRITNSFDKSEVFEFPPGTSESDARAAVADLLLKRAIERMN